MWRARPIAAVVAALLSGATLLALAALPATAEARPLVTGITNLGTNDPLAFARTRETGARFVRVQIHWEGAVPDAEPVGWRPDDPSDPNYDWSESDAAAIQAVAAGLTPVFQVGGVPQWAQRCKTPPSLPSYALCDPEPAKLQAFATAAARRYAGGTPGVPRVRYWQILNEPNLSLYFFPQFDVTGKALSPSLYRDLVNAFSAGVKSVLPSNLVLAGGLGPVAVPPWTIGPMRFAREMLCMKGHAKPKPTPGDCGGGVDFDIFAMQPYSTGGPLHEGGVNDVQIGDLGKLQTLLRAADKAGRINGHYKRTPLWITEFSWDSNPPDPGGLSMPILTRWTAEAMHTAWQAGVSHFFWYSLHDGESEPQRSFSETLQSGLYFRGPTLAQDEPKPVLYAFRFPFVAYPGKKGLSFWGRTPSSGAGKVTIQVKDGRGWHKVASLRAGKDGIFQGMAKTGYGRGGKGYARAHFSRGSSLPFSMHPVEEFRHPPFG